MDQEEGIFQDFAIFEDRFLCQVTPAGKVQWSLVPRHLGRCEPAPLVVHTFEALPLVAQEYNQIRENFTVFELDQLTLGTSVKRGEWLYHTKLPRGKYFMHTVSDSRSRIGGMPYTPGLMCYLLSFRPDMARFLPSFVRSTIPDGRIISRFPWFLLAEPVTLRLMLECGKEGPEVDRRLRVRKKITEFVGAKRMAELISAGKLEPKTEPSQPVKVHKSTA